MMIPNYSGEVPYVTTEQMIEVDRAMMEDVRIELMQMMENAGRNLAHLARVHFFDGDPRGKTVVVLAGTGGNGGGALVCARRLHNWGAQVQAFLTHPATDFTLVPAHQLDILQRMNVPVAQADILIAAIGRPAFIRGDFIKPGATVIDVGVNKVTDIDRARNYYAHEAERRIHAIEKRGYTLVGDVHPADADRIAGKRTPVPGGVGLLTVAMLMKNTLQAAKWRRGL